MNKTTIRIEGSGPTWKLTSKSGTVTAGQQGSLWHMMVIARENFSTWPPSRTKGIKPFIISGYQVYVVLPYRMAKHYNLINSYRAWPVRLCIPLGKVCLP